MVVILGMVMPPHSMQGPGITSGPGMLGVRHPGHLSPGLGHPLGHPRPMMSGHPGQMHVRGGMIPQGHPQMYPGGHLGGLGGEGHPGPGHLGAGMMAGHRMVGPPGLVNYRPSAFMFETPIRVGSDVLLIKPSLA